MESSKEYARYECWEIGPNLRRALQGYCYHECRSILLGGPKRKIASLAMECPQLKEVLSLISCTWRCKLNVIFVYMFYQLI